MSEIKRTERPGARIWRYLATGGWRDAVTLAAFIAALILIFYKCPYGFANRDESFYLTIPYRLCQGDGLLWDEYHLSQLSSVLIYPIMRVYLWLAPSTEGMLLAFRYIFTTLHAATAVFIYLRQRRVTVNAPFAALLYLLFTPFGIMALSYNSMGIALLTIAAVLIYTLPEGKLAARVTAVLAGLAFAGAVLCCPYLLLVFVYYGVLVLVDLVGRLVKRNAAQGAAQGAEEETTAPLWKSFVFFTAGCAAAALLFLIFLMTRASLGEILDALPLILTDPEHPSRKFTAILTEFLTSIVGSNERAPVLLLGVGAICIAITADRKKERHAPLYLLAAAALVIYYTKPFITTNIYLNYLMFPLSAFGLPCYLLLGRRGLRELLIFWLPGVLYGIAMTWSSNQRFYVISDAALLASIGSLILLGKVCASMKGARWEKTLQWSCRGALVLLLCGYLVSTAEVRYDSLFWETGKTMEDMTEMITVGAERGIYTTTYKKATYENLYRQSAPVREHDGEQVLYFTKDTWLYLDDQKNNAAYSAWTSGVSATASQKMVDYYTLNPEKLPDVIFVYSADWQESSPLARFFDERGYTRTTIGNAYMLEKAPGTA